MFKDDIDLVTEMIARYGLRKPLVDLGGLARPTIADYAITMATGDQRARYIHTAGRPFDFIDRDYAILNPEQGDPSIEELLPARMSAFGTILCLSVLEHVRNPFDVFEALKELLKPGGLLILSTVFSFPYHPSPDDNWRFSPNALRILAEHAHLEVLACDWRLNINADAGVKEIHTGVSQEIISTYLVARR